MARFLIEATTAPSASRCAAGLCLALAAMAPPFVALWEKRMLTHMLLQIPALLFAGGLLCTAWRPARPERWNLAGVSGLLAVSLALAFWMMPIALDHAVASADWDAVKVLSLMLAGALGVRSWLVAPTVVRAFFVGNFVWMSVTAGMLYQDEGRRLCNAYLQDDQAITGCALVWLAIVCGVSWIALTSGMSYRAANPSAPQRTLS